MIKDIRPKSYIIYLSLPILGPVINDFVKWSSQRGYTTGTIRNQLKDARHIAIFFQQQGVQTIEELNRDLFDTAWKHFIKRRYDTAGTIRQIELFIGQSFGLTDATPSPQGNVALEIDKYRQYLKEIRGLGESTISSHSQYTEEFLKHIGYESDQTVINDLNLKQIETFIQICSRRLNRHSLQHVVAYLRSFLRFEFAKGNLERPLFEMIETPVIYRGEQLPKSLTSDTIKRLLLSIDRSNFHGLRDYTILFLMVTYGLRSHEITALTLDDINWQAGSIHIFQSKNKKYHLLPLIETVAGTLIEYLKKNSAPRVQRVISQGSSSPSASKTCFHMRYL